MTMQEKQIFARAVGIQKENLGLPRIFIFHVGRKCHYVVLYFRAFFFLELWLPDYLLKMHLLDSSNPC